jgi:WD40 repeat protein
METRWVSVVKQHTNAQYTYFCSLEKDTYNPSTTFSKMSQLIPCTTPLRVFEDHEKIVRVLAVFPDRRRMVTGSGDKTLRLWDLETGVVLKKMEGHKRGVWALAVSRDGQTIASGDGGGEVIAWHGDTGESLTKPIKAHSKQIFSMDFSPDGSVLATGRDGPMIKFWCTKTWQMQGDPIDEYCQIFRCVRYSPSGELLAIATAQDILIYNSVTRERVISLRQTQDNSSLAWTPDGTRLLSGGGDSDPTIREWDSTTWQQVGLPWEGHTDTIATIAIHPAGTLIASASYDDHIRLWRLSDQRTIAIFRHSPLLCSVTFSVDGRHILSGNGGQDNNISEWEIRHVQVSFHS